MPSPTVSNHEEWQYTVVNLATDSTTVCPVPAVIGNIWVNTVLSAHACPIIDGATTLFTIPLSTAAGTTFTHMKGTVFLTNIIVDPDNAATGSIVVQWTRA